MTTISPMPTVEDGVRSTPRVEVPAPAGKSAHARAFDDLEEALVESFPASDPPIWWAGPPDHPTSAGPARS